MVLYTASLTAGIGPRLMMLIIDITIARTIGSDGWTQHEEW